MAVRKVSVALDASVATSAAKAAEMAGLSFSAWLSRAAEHELALERGRRAVAAWEREHGSFSADELARADSTLERLLGNPKRPPKRRSAVARRHL